MHVLAKPPDEFRIERFTVAEYDQMIRDGTRSQGTLGPMYFVATTTSSYHTVRVVPPPLRS